MSGADLHVHTLEGSNEGDPARQVVEAARDSNLEAIAITDHSSVAGIQIAKEAAVDANLSIIPGVELDTIWKERRCHVLGLFCPYKNAGFRQELYEKFEKPRNRRVLAMADRLSDKNLITEDDREKLSSALRKLPGSISTESLVHQCIILFSGADNLLGEGIRNIIEESDDETSDGWQEVMHRYFHPKAAEKTNCHVPYQMSEHVSLPEAFKFVHKYRIVAGLAHLFDDFNSETANDVFDTALGCGAQIIGSKHPRHKSEHVRAIDHLIEYANTRMERHLIRIDSSDYHGRRSMYPIGIHRTSMEVVRTLAHLND